MPSTVSIANRALTKLGAQRILSLGDASEQARVMNSMFEDVRDAELRRYRWKFAASRASLLALVDAPAWGYAYQYPLPADYLALVQVGEIYVRGSKFRGPWSVERGAILTDLSAPLQIRYIAKVTDPTLFDPLFAEMLSCKLAWEACEAITQSSSKKGDIKDEYRYARDEAVRVDAIENPPDELPNGSWLDARGYGDTEFGGGLLMGKQSALISSFNSGELTPLLDGRVDFAKYANGATVMENFIPTVQGPIVRRAGTRFVADTKFQGQRAYLQKFEFSVTQAYMLEFGDFYIRFFTTDSFGNRGRLEVLGVPIEVVTPYALANMFNADGTCRLRFAQSADVLYITHPDYPPQELRRLTATSFSLVPFVNRGGPWDTRNLTATTIYASAATGSVTLTASAAVWTADDVGNIWYLENPYAYSALAWEVGQTVAVNDLRRSEGKVYRAATGGVTGTNRPVHTEGIIFDGSAVSWEYLDAGYGYVRITGYTSPTQISATVVDRLPTGVIGSGGATTRWAAPAWRKNGASSTWPACVAFYRERLFFARGQKVWGSVSADFSDFHPKSFDQVTDDMAISLTIVSGNINDIQWMTPEKELLLGTAGAEFTLGELQNGDPLGPGNVRVKLQSQFGSRSIVPITLGESTLFVQRSGKKAREIFYDFSSDGYKSTDTTVLAEHISSTGFVDLDLAQEPDPIVWCVRADGQLVGFTWNNEQEVRAWHRHPIGGNGFVLSVATMPAFEGDRNELWMIVRRTINGQIREYVEFMEKPIDKFDPASLQFYVDCGLTYRGPATNLISGLQHLVGQTVDVLVDGVPHPQRVVELSGSITLQSKGTVIHVGLPCPAKWRSTRIEAGAQDGTAQGKTKRTNKVVYRFLRTGGGKYGPDEQHLDWFQFRSPADPMSQPVPLYTGDMVVQWPGGYDTNGYFMYVNDQPTSACLEMVSPQVTTQDAR